MRRLLPMVVVYLLVGGFSLSSFANQYESEWVDNTSIGEHGTDIALDSNSHPGICYYDAANHVLKYAYHDGNNWATEVVDNRGRDDRGKFCAIIFDDNDRPHIVYYNVTRGQILHARKTNGNWTYRHVDNQNEGDILLRATKQISIAKDTLGHIGVAYYDSTNKDLIFAEWDGNGWATEAVESDGDVGRTPSLAYDANDLPAIAAMKYANAAEAALLFIRHNGIDWEDPETADDDDFSGAFSSLKFDSNNVPHVAYQALDANGIQSMNYTNKVGGRWNEPLVLYTGAAAGASVGTFAEMVLGADGDAHLIYRYYFFSALFGAVHYLKITHLFDVRQSVPQNLWIRSENLKFSAVPRLDYSGLALAMDDNHELVFSYADQNFADRNFSLASGRLTVWSPMIILLTPNAANRQAVGERMEITWTDFDPDSNAQILFYYRNADFNLFQVGEVVNEDGANRTELNTANLRRGSYTLLARISDDDFQTFSDSVPPDQLLIANRNPGRADPRSRDGMRVSSRRPLLQFEAASDSDNDPLTYEVEIYADSNMNRLISRQEGIRADGNNIDWRVDVDLNDNTSYYWRVRSRDVEGAASAWSELRSFSTFINDAPTSPVPHSEPEEEIAEEGDEEGSVVLAVENALDEEGDAITYTFQVCADEACNDVLQEIENVDAGVDGLTEVSIDISALEEGEYFWRALAKDANGESSAWSPAASFFVSALKSGDSGSDSGKEDSGEGAGEGTENAGAGAPGCNLTTGGPAPSAGFPVFVLALLIPLIVRCRVAPS